MEVNPYLSPPLISGGISHDAIFRCISDAALRTCHFLPTYCVNAAYINGNSSGPNWIGCSAGLPISRRTLPSTIPRDDWWKRIVPLLIPGSSGAQGRRL